MGCRDLLVVVAVLGGCDKVYDLGGRMEPDSSGGTDAFDLRSCPGSYAEVTNAPLGSVYRYVADYGRTWLFAHDDCLDDAGGFGHLVVIDDLTELTALRAGNPLNGQGYWQTWTGFARDTEGDPELFYSVTGDELPKLSPLWGPMEPNNEGGSEENATAFSQNALLYDIPYDATVVHGYICECDGRHENLRFRVP